MVSFSSLLVALLIFVFLKGPLLAGVFLFSSVVGLIISAIMSLSNQKVEVYLLQWLSDIRWFSDAFAMEDEYRLTVEETHKIK